jgi:hypothetical protein
MKSLNTSCLSAAMLCLAVMHADAKPCPSHAGNPSTKTSVLMLPGLVAAQIREHLPLLYGRTADENPSVGFFDPNQGAPIVEMPTLMAQQDDCHKHYVRCTRLLTARELWCWECIDRCGVTQHVGDCFD